MALWRDRPPTGAAELLLQGAGVWMLFTGLLAGVGWCVLVLPLALLLPSETIVRWRWAFAGFASLVALGLIGREVGLFKGGAETAGAWKTRLFWNTGLWATTYAVCTALRLARALRRS